MLTESAEREGRREDTPLASLTRASPRRELGCQSMAVRLALSPSSQPSPVLGDRSQVYLKRLDWLERSGRERPFSCCFVHFAAEDKCDQISMSASTLAAQLMQP